MVLEEGDKNGDYRQAREGTNKPVNTSVSSFSTQTVSNCLLLDNMIHSGEKERVK